MDDTIRIYHNPACSKSRAALALVQAAGVAVEVIDYLAAPPDAATLAGLAAAIPGGARALLRGDADGALDDAAILALIAADPASLNRPIVASPRGVSLCRPPETVLALLPDAAAARAKAAMSPPR